MAFQLKAREPVNTGIKRIVSQELDKAHKALTKSNNTRKSVHSARVHFKKIRAVLRLVRDEVGKNIYRLENDCFRDAARPLTEVRDAKVQIDTLDKLAKHFPKQIDQATVAEVRK